MQWLRGAVAFVVWSGCCAAMATPEKGRARAAGTKGSPSSSASSVRRAPVARAKAAKPGAAQLSAQAVKALVAQLSSSSVKRRTSAAKALGAAQKYHQPAAKALVKALHDKDIHVRWAAAGSLRRLEGRSVSALLAAVKQKRLLLWRLRAIRVLELLCKKAQAATASMAMMLNDKAPKVRREVARWLNACGGPASLVVPALVNALGDGDWRVALEASHGLRKRGRLAVKPLLKALSQPLLSLRAAKTLADLKALGVPGLCRALTAPMWQTRYAATYGLGAWRPKKIPCLEGIVGGLKAKAWHLRALSAQILGKARSKRPAHIAALRQRLKDPAWQVRRQAAYALLLVGHRNAELLPPILAALGGKHPQAAQEAAYALARLGALATAPLIQRLKHRQSRVRHAAAYALSLLKHASLVRAIPGLLKACKDPNKGVRIVALHALQEAARHKDPKVQRAARRALKTLPKQKPSPRR